MFMLFKQFLAMFASRLCCGGHFVHRKRDIEIINNTREGIIIFFSENRRERVFRGANSSPGCRARHLLAELMLPW